MSDISIGNNIQTKKNSKQQKSKIGGYSGLVVGGAFSTYKTIKNIKYLKSSDCNEYFVSSYNKMKTSNPAIENMPLEKFIKMSKTASKAVTGVFALGTVAIGFGLGKLLDKAVNSFKAKKTIPTSANK